MPEPAEPRYKCHRCEEELVFDVKIGRRDMCPNCASYLHCCYNCVHWDRNVHNQCKENQGEFIRDRAEGNFCLYFTFKTIGDEGPSEADDAKARLAALFGGGSTESPGVAPASSSAMSEEDAARAKLEALFKK